MEKRKPNASCRSTSNSAACTSLLAVATAMATYNASRKTVFVSRLPPTLGFEKRFASSAVIHCR